MSSRVAALRILMLRPEIAGNRCPYLSNVSTAVSWPSSLGELEVAMDEGGRHTSSPTDAATRFTEPQRISPTDGIDSSTAAGRMMIGVLGSLAEYERELTRGHLCLHNQRSR
jgi:hypothetical protein